MVENDVLSQEKPSIVKFVSGMWGHICHPKEHKESKQESTFIEGRVLQDITSD